MSKSLEEYRNIGKQLSNKLRLLTIPVAIKFIEDYDEIPQEAQRPSKMGQKISLCQSFTMGRRWGAHVAMTYEDNVPTAASCPSRHGR
ncbi:MAG: DUF169 domain-containing protein [Promethearchaeia archaeon]